MADRCIHGQGRDKPKTVPQPRTSSEFVSTAKRGQIIATEIRSEH